MLVHTEKENLKPREFRRLSQFVYQNFGILLPPSKRGMAESRLQIRLQALQMASYREYMDFVLSPAGKREVFSLIDRISTNKTDFFREGNHFKFLREVILPRHEKKFAYQELKVWSSGASSGEECYSIGISIEEYIRAHQRAINYSIIGTDISVFVLKQATGAVYPLEQVRKIPPEIVKRYFLRNKDAKKKIVRVEAKLRQKIKFQWLNLIDDHYNLFQEFDVIFCRNVLIYFDRKTQEAVIRKLCGKLRSGGYLLLGHSETISNVDFPLRRLGSTIYQKE